ncbi:MAG: EpsG family protein [Thalassotalea sp.]
MLPYLICILLSVGIFHISYRYKFDTIALRITHVIAALPLVTLTGFKYIKVGTDTGSYVFYFEKIKNFQDVLDISSTHGEFGFWFLNYLGRLMTEQYFIIFLLSSVMVTACYFYTINRFNLKTLSFVCLLFIGPYFFQLNGVRQAITIAIFSISVIFIIEKKPIPYLISIIIGFLFHKSMIVCLPLYFLFKDDITPKKVGVILFAFVVLLLGFEKFISIAASVDDRYKSYGDKQNAVGGALVSSVNFLWLGWFIICRLWHKATLATRTYDVLLMLYLLGVMVSALSIILRIDPSGFLRMSIYFIQLNVFLIPMTILSFQDRAIRLIVTVAVLVFMFMYFYLTTSTFSNLVPYHFYGYTPY